MSRRSSLALTLLLALCAGTVAAQQTNGANGALDLNGSSAMGSAPYSVMIEQPNALQIGVVGLADQPFVLLAGAMTDIGNTIYSTGQIDVGPTPTVVLDGISGPFYPYFANTGPTGSKVITVPVPSGSVTLGTPLASLQALVVDPTSGPFNLSFTAASEFGFVANAGANALPIADAGVSSFANGLACVSLDGTGSSDPEGMGLSYSWTQISGTTVTLSSSTSATPSFVAPTGPESLVFELIVNDGVQDSLPATVYIAVQTPVATVSFANDVLPIYQGGGCTGCHGSAGGLTISGTAAQLYAEFTDPANASGNRIDVCDPASSLILTKPSSFGTYASSHSTNIFSSTAAANYITVITWITEGAQFN